MKKNSYIKGILVVLAAFFGITYTLSQLAWYRANTQKPLVQYVGNIEIWNTAFKKQSLFKEGDSFIIHSHVIRQPYECWADYAASIVSSSVSYSIGINKSNIISDKAVETDLNIGYTIPSHLPSGDYIIRIVVFPECKGYDLPPFVANLGSPTFHITGD